MLCADYFLARVRVSPQSKSPGNAEAPSKAYAVSYGKLPLIFEANQGQTDKRVKFISHEPGYALFLTRDAMVLKLSRKGTGQRTQAQMADPRLPIPSRQLFISPNLGFRAPAFTLAATGNASQKTHSVVQANLVGANPDAIVSGKRELPGKANYFIGNDPRRWRTNVPTYARVLYQSVYPNVDLVYYGTQDGRLECDFVVRPGGDPRAIALEVGTRHQGVDSKLGGENMAAQPAFRIAPNGDLIIPTEDGEVHFRKPVVYQEGEFGAGIQESEGPSRKRKSAIAQEQELPVHNRKFLDGRYVVKADGQVGFQVGSYNRSLPLVIDPVLVYSTYLGGSNTDVAYAIATDAAGNAYLTGEALSSDFPTANPIQASLRGYLNGFVTKLNPAGSALVYSTYLGGTNSDGGMGIAVDSSGNAYVTGNTNSTDFPTVNPLQKTNKAAVAHSGQFTGFACKLNSSGSALVYSTYLGGSFQDMPAGIAVDSSGNAYVTGSTLSADFPTVNAFQANYSGGDAFVAKLNAAGSALVYSTFLGGASVDGAGGIAVDSSGSAYVTGQTASADFPLVKPLQAVNHAADATAFVVKLNSSGSALQYSTYLGGSILEGGTGIAVDSSGAAYLTGTTSSADFPTVNPLQASLGGVGSAFVAKLNPSGSALVFSTYLGGSTAVASTLSVSTLAHAIALDSSGNAYITGETDATDFPTVNPVQAKCPACASFSGNAFVTEFSSDGSTLIFSTYLGGSWLNIGNGIAVDPSGSILLTGENDAADFPTVNPLQPAMKSPYVTSFVAKISTAPTPSVGLSPRNVTFGPQDILVASQPQNVTVTNTGTARLNLSTAAIAGADGGDFALSADACTGSALAPGGSCTVSVTFAPSAVETRSASLTFTDDAPDSPQSVALTGWGGSAVPVASLSPSDLAFGNEFLFNSSAPQPVTLTNMGNAPLTIRYVTSSIGFTVMDNTCGNSLQAGASCAISISFAPYAAGPLSGTLTLTDNSKGLAGSQQVVSLSGAGQGFTLGPAAGSSASATVAAGQSAKYTLTLASEGGFNQNVSFSCSGAPSEATCTVSPASVTAGNTPVNVTVTVTTTASSASAPRTGPTFPPTPRSRVPLDVLMVAVALATMALLRLLRKRSESGRWRLALIAVTLEALMVVAFMGCGGGTSGNGGGEKNDPGTPAGIYTLNVQGTANAETSTLNRSVYLELRVL
jgi:Beta-propeller repeat/Cep192 domain 4